MAASDKNKFSCLIVEDDGAFASMAAQVVRDEGGKVTVVPNLAEARAVTSLEFFGESSVMREVMSQLRQAAKHTASTVLLTGETGTGKDLAARMLHQIVSPDGKLPFVAVNCAAQNAAHSPARIRNVQDSSARPRAARCSWMKSRKCRSRCSPSCCVVWRSGWSCGLSENLNLPDLNPSECVVKLCSH